PSGAEPIEYDTTLWFACSQFLLLSESTVGAEHGSTSDSRSAASKSDLRKRHTRRFVPESAKAFTFPWRAQRRTVRTFTLRYRAASRAVIQSIAEKAETPSPGCEPGEASSSE